MLETDAPSLMSDATSSQPSTPALDVARNLPISLEAHSLLPAPVELAVPSVVFCPTKKEDAPYPLLPIPLVPSDKVTDLTETLYRDMSLIHNVYIRAINSIYINGPKAAAKDVKAFCGYALTVIRGIHNHHHGEEQIIFPFLADVANLKDSEGVPHQTHDGAREMEINKAQHDAFTGGMDELEGYLKKVRDGQEQLDGWKVRGLVLAFAGKLVEHLNDEIPTIRPERLRKYDLKKLEAMWEVQIKHIRASPVTTEQVLILSHHDPMTQKFWPPMPVPVRWFISKVASRRYSEYWKFSPWTPTGQKQTYTGA